MKTVNAFKTIAKTGILAAALILTACSDDDSSGSGGSSNSFIKAKVDNVQFKNLEIQGHSTTVATTSGTGDGRLIMISGADANMNNMAIIMMGINETGEYTIDPEDDGSVLAYVPSNSPSYDTSNCAGATGTLKITKINDERVEGTFSFVGKDDENCTATKTITAGSFRGIFLQAEN